MAEFFLVIEGKLILRWAQDGTSVEMLSYSLSKNQMLEIAKYSAKGSNLYHSETVFDTFYISLKKRQLLVYSGLFKEFAKKYENVLRELSPEEFEEFNKRALFIEEDDEREE